jgi:hypothetical protein
MENQLLLIYVLQQKLFSSGIQGKFSVINWKMEATKKRKGLVGC